MWLVCGYYTGKVYETHAQKLKESLISLNLPHDIVAVDEQGDWYKNTQYKPTFLKQMLEKHYPNSIVYLDADAIVCRHPSYFDKLDREPDVNIAVHMLDHSKRRRKNHAAEMLSGTIFLKNSKTTHCIIDDWIKICSRGGRLWDQHALAQVLKKYKFHLLPEEYTTIFDYMSDVKNPVIKHFQASREERRKMREGSAPQLGGKLASQSRTVVQNGQVKIKRMSPR